jgi:hypothetical protein
MEKGIEFLKAQVHNAAALHHTFLESLKTHAEQADDPRFRALCEKYIPTMSRHQTMLEQYQRTIGAGEGVLKKTLGGVMETAKEWVEAARGDDYLALVSDIVMARQGEDTFKTFREAGRLLGDDPLRQLGEMGEAEHDKYVQEANRLVQQFFYEHVQVPAAVRS